MFERFTKDAREVVRRASKEAEAAGSASVDAEHLLAALLAGPSGVRATLARAGLDAGGWAEALAEEEAASLAAVGVDAADWAMVRPRPARGRSRVGASSKVALERTLRAAMGRGDRRIGPEHVLLGVLAADVGRVPRALELAGVDRAALRAAL